ncbi:L,D-transpeptidase family protein [Xanthobacteraceae bacterium A53D]
MKRSLLTFCTLALLAALGGPAQALTADAVNAAAFTPEIAKAEQKAAEARAKAAEAEASGKPEKSGKAKPRKETKTEKARKAKEAEAQQGLITKVQVLLSRRSISPGEIDGMDGENYRKALAQFRLQNNLGAGDILDEQTWIALGGPDAASIVADYKLTKKDTSAKFPKTIPKDYAKQAKMKKLDYTSLDEMLAERFHMSRGLLLALNPGFRKAKDGDTIAVLAIERQKPEAKVERVEAVKSTGMVVVYGADNAILASFPATIGSEDTPSPEGEHTVKRIVFDPPYYYDPEKNFQQGKNKKKLVLPAGPNNPVGSVWIALSKETFGIHGTPEPSKVSKTSSHGCVRLTNWDAAELAEMLKPGVKVRFVDQPGA